MIINILLNEAFNFHRLFGNMSIMGAPGFPWNFEHRTHDKKDLAPPDSQTETETPLLFEEDSLETMTTPLCPYGYEIAKDNLDPSRAGSTEPPPCEVLSHLTRQLKAQQNVEVLDWKQYAAEKENLLIGILNWALSLIDTTQSLQESLRNVLARFAKAQDQVVTLRREREEAAGVRASLEMRLNDTGILLKTAEDRAMTLEGEVQQMATEFASIKREVEYRDRRETPLLGSLVKTTG